MGGGEGGRAVVPHFAKGDHENKVAGSDKKTKLVSLVFKSNQIITILVIQQQ